MYIYSIYIYYTYTYAYTYTFIYTFINICTYIYMLVCGAVELYDAWGFGGSASQGGGCATRLKRNTKTITK